MRDASLFRLLKLDQRTMKVTQPPLEHFVR